MLEGFFADDGFTVECSTIDKHLEIVG